MSEYKFAEAQKQIMRFSNEGQLEKALHSITKAEEEFPNKFDKFSYWKACIYAKMGDFNTTLIALETATEKGFWWNPTTLLQTEEFQQLKDEPRFIHLISLCQHRIDEQKDKCETVIASFGNPKADIVILSLHWRSANIQDFSTYWLSPKLEEKYHYVFIQSSQVFGYNAFCWDDFHIAKNDIATALKEFDLKGKKVIIAGASQGAKLAMELLLLKQMDAIGFIAVVPAIRSKDELRQLIQQRNVTNKKGFIITGTKDLFYEETVAISAILNENNIPNELLVIKDMGHFFPTNFIELIPKAVNYILR
ncbi:MAG: alpha/beta hydrolase [Bacillaceae bacterium]